MTEQDSTRTTRGEIEALLIWLSDRNRRWLSLFVLVLYLFVAAGAVAIRWSWRTGVEEPVSRTQYALVTTFADSLLVFGFVLVVVALAAPVYRIWWGGSSE